jgi:hypothetical protein
MAVDVRFERRLHLECNAAAQATAFEGHHHLLAKVNRPQKYHERRKRWRCREDPRGLVPNRMVVNPIHQTGG